jgi:hypothetical protein
MNSKPTSRKSEDDLLLGLGRLVPFNRLGASGRSALNGGRRGFIGIHGNIVVVFPSEKRPESISKVYVIWSPIYE